MKVEQKPDGSFEFHDVLGVRGRFKDAETMAAHFAAMIEQDKTTLYYDAMDALKRSRREHGDCKSGERYNGKPLACSACMANLTLDAMLENYKGRPVTIAHVESSDAKDDGQ